jgi:transposase
MPKSNISKRLAQVQPGTLHVGVDLALEKNVAVVINERAERLDQFSFSQDRSGYDYFLQRLEGVRQNQHASELLVAMEPTNYFWKLLARELEQHKITYHLVNSYTVKRHREGDQMDRSKDDRRDAKQIAELSRTGHYTQTRLQAGAYEDLRQYASVYAQVQRSIRRQKQVLWALVGQVFPELFQVFKNLEGDTSQALVMTCTPAAFIRQMTIETFIKKVRSAYTGKRLLVSKLARLHQLAATSIGVTEGLSAIQLAIQVHLNYLQTLEKELEQVTSAMTASLLSLPEAPYLLSIKSLGPVSAATFLADIGDPKRYQAAAQWVKLAGIQPVPRTSGMKQRSRTPMSHQGRPRLRTMLYFTCMRMVQQDQHFAQLYAHLQKRSNNPLTKMQALGVLMNKLLHILWALIHDQTFYNPAFSQST